MSLFSRIQAKLGFGDKPEDITAATRHPAQSPVEGVSQEAVSQVDVLSRLEHLANTHPETLNWKTSIVDLLKLLGLDSSLASRKELASELGCPAEKMGDSAQMNTWLHQTVLTKLAENGGNIPANLLQ
jgi:hypothetical protein